jgi:Domain of unknown function (DUF4287)/Domain of unknown function (DUF5655)
MDIDAALQKQISNIEATYGKPVEHWFGVIEASGRTRHSDVVAMLKTEHGLAHGAAHRLSLLARQRGADTVTDPVDALYSGRRAGLRSLHDALLAEIGALGPFTVTPKKGYVSLRRRVQFAMVPAQHHGPHRPRPDPPAGNADGRPAGNRGRFQRAVHPPRPPHRIGPARRRAARPARGRL